MQFMESVTHVTGSQSLSLDNKFLLQPVMNIMLRCK